MSTTSYAQQITELMRLRPAFDAPQHVKDAWIERKIRLVAKVEAVEQARNSPPASS